MFALFSLLACQPAVEDTALEPPLPEIWGLDAAEDHDPAPDTVEVHLTAAETQVEWISGEDTTAWAYNGQVPGPLIQARVGDTIRVVFTNQLDEETTIHWHGLRISDEMDGVPIIQDPVQPGETFTYEFVAPDPGSYWYHPHVRSHEQIERGLHGAIVIHEESAPEVDNDRYFVYDDVYLRDGGGFYGFEPSNNHSLSVHGRYGNTLLVNGQNALDQPLSGTVRPGGVERWRIVNSANARTFKIDVDGAHWRVIAVDGALLPQPYQVGKYTLPVGGRVDIEVVPKLDSESVVLEAILPGGGGERYPMFEATVEGDPGDESWVYWAGPELPEVLPATQEIKLKFDGYSDGGIAHWTINGELWEDHEAIPVQANTPTLIELVEKSGGDHPFHLHGQFFQLLERDGEPADEPGMMDTLQLEGDGEALIYTTFDNPGRWMAHCHILEHAEMGMMTELVVE